MDWLQFISAMVGNLAWPVVVLIVVFAIRKHLGSLTDRILELSFGGASMKFGKLLSKGAEIIEESPVQLPSAEPQLPLPAREAPEGQPAPANQGGWSDPFATKGGIFNIFSAYEMTERILGDIGELLDVKTRSGPTIMRMLLKRDLVAPQLVELFETLRQGRNAVAHGSTSMPNEAETAEFMRQALYLNIALYQVLKSLRGKNKNP
jgi:hypothetical protein